MPLDQYAAIVGIDPWHFNQVTWPENPFRQNCRDVWLQYSYQWPDRASRNALAEAIAQAESRIAEYIDFFPAPKYITEEQHPYPRQRRVIDGTGPIPFPAYHEISRRKTVRLDWLRISSAGRRCVVEIETDAPVLFSDTTGDGFNDHAEITLAASSAPDGAAEKEIAVFAPDATTAQENRIRAVDVDIAEDGAITISGRAAVFVDPDAWAYFEGMVGEHTGPEAYAIDGLDASNFLDAVDVYWIYPSTAGDDYAPCEFGWERRASTAIATASGTLQVRDADRSIITPILADWNEDTEGWDVASCSTYGEPHLVRTWYYAGWPTDDRGWLTAPFARAVAALATAYLNRPLCGCGSAEELASYWQEIPAAPEGVWGTITQLNCPFGPQRGAWEAYTLCRDSFDSIGGVSL
jgi:hypothetical protein